MTEAEDVIRQLVARLGDAADFHFAPKYVDCIVEEYVGKIAELGDNGTCHLEEIEKDCDTASEYMLEREYCFDAVYRCSCGCRFGHVAYNRPRFCPNCGRKVVDE